MNNGWKKVIIVGDGNLVIKTLRQDPTRGLHTQIPIDNIIYLKKNKELNFFPNNTIRIISELFYINREFLAS